MFESVFATYIPLCKLEFGAEYPFWGYWNLVILLNKPFYNWISLKDLEFSNQKMVKTVFETHFSFWKLPFWQIGIKKITNLRKSSPTHCATECGKTGSVTRKPALGFSCCPIQSNYHPIWSQQQKRGIRFSKDWLTHQLPRKILGKIKFSRKN